MNDVPEQVSPQSSGTFFSRFVWALTAPKRLYEDIAAESPWWQPWVWVSIINMIIAYIGLPIQKQLVSLRSSELSSEELEQTLEAMDSFGILGVVTAPIVVLITSLIIAGISFLVVSVQAQEANFRKYWTLYLYGSVIASIGLLLGTIVTLMKGVGNIRSIEDAYASFGPAFLASAKVPHAILSTLDVFSVWFYILIAGGVMRIFGMSRMSAIFVVVPIWLLYVLFALVSSSFSGV
jgi:hypothetical protein